MKKVDIIEQPLSLGDTVIVYVYSSRGKGGLRLATITEVLKKTVRVEFTFDGVVHRRFNHFHQCLRVSPDTCQGLPQKKPPDSNLDFLGKTIVAGDWVAFSNDDVRCLSIGSVIEVERQGYVRIHLLLEGGEYLWLTPCCSTLVITDLPAIFPYLIKYAPGARDDGLALVGWTWA